MVRGHPAVDLAGKTMVDRLSACVSRQPLARWCKLPTGPGHPVGCVTVQVLIEMDSRQLAIRRAGPGRELGAGESTVLACRGEGRDDGKARRTVTGGSHWRHAIAVGALLLHRAMACAPLLDPRPSTGVPESELPSRDSPPGASCASLLSQRLIHSPQCGSLRLCTRDRPESWLPSRECA